MTQSNHSHSKEKKRRKMTHWTKARTISNRANTKSCRSMCSPWDLERNHVSCKGLGSLLSAALLPEAHTLTVLCQFDSMCAAVLSRCLMVLTPPTHWGINRFTFIVSYQVLSESLCMDSEPATHYLDRDACHDQPLQFCNFHSINGSTTRMMLASPATNIRCILHPLHDNCISFLDAEEALC